MRRYSALVSPWSARAAALFTALLAAFAATGCANGPRSAATSPPRYVVTAYGAVGDGATLNTAALQRAIDAAATAGGVVEIPAGTFRSGSIFLRPGVELHLAEGAVLLGSNNIEDYPKRNTRIEGHFEPWRMALVNAQQMKGVRITGKGVLNGNGRLFWQQFWQARRDNPAVTNLAVERPRLLFIDQCEDVRIEGISLQDSGFWNLHLYRCREVVVHGIRITAPSGPAPAATADLATAPIRAPSSDGIDIDSCQNVVVSHCYISCGDDNIALKGSKGPLADRDQDSPPVQNILIEHCEFGDGNGFTCGSEATVVRDVLVRHHTITGRTKLLTLKLRPDTPQHYSNITIEHVTLKGGNGTLLDVGPWLQFFDLKGQPAPARTVENITLRDIRGSYGSFGRLLGNEPNATRGTLGDTLRNITVENVDVTLTNGRLNVGNVQNLTFKDVIVNGAPYDPAAPASPAAPAAAPAQPR